MMDHRLDDHLSKLDEQAIEDGEARYDQSFCYYCRGYYPREEMGDVMCLTCEGFGGPDVVARLIPAFEKVLASVKAKHERVKGMDLIVRMTLKEGKK